VVGLVLAVLVTGMSLWLAQHPPVPAAVAVPRIEFAGHLVSPAAAIGLALLALAWAERNRALVWFTVVYLVVVLVPGSLSPVDIDRPDGLSPWGFLPRVLVTAVVLLLGSLGFAMRRTSVGQRAP
jgi:hypothetical protein